MKSVKISKSDLLQKVKANREIHKADYDEALIIFRKVALEKLNALVKAAKSADTPTEKLVTSADLTRPVTYLQEYDRVISMLEFSVDDVIELDVREFDRYVLDNWEWKQVALVANSFYK